MPTPNLLFLFTDQQRYDTFAAYGNTRIHMPNLDRLAEQSVVFDRAYVSQPVCTPSRSTLLTGLWPHTSGCVQNNIPLRDDTPCLPEMLLKGRFATGYHGKWHLGDEVFAQHGFDEWVSIEDMYIDHYREGRDRSVRSSYHHFLVRNGIRPENGDRFRRMESVHVPEPISKPAFLAGTASEFIRRNRKNPFVLFVNFLEPHSPYWSVRDEQYAPNEIYLPPDFDLPPGEQHPLKTRLFARAHSATHKTEAEWRSLISRYWGLCSLVDTHVGTILRALEDTGLLDSTIIVYTSDHGDMMGSHRLVGKGVQFEEASRVPLMVRLPGRRAARRVLDPVSHIDVVPTLLDLLGQNIPNHLQGKSLRPLLEGRTDRNPDDVFIEWTGKDFAKQMRSLQEKGLLDDVPLERAIAAEADPVRTILTRDGWKLNCTGSGETELYNLFDDPWEMRNHAALGQHPGVLARLADRIRAWQERTGDTAVVRTERG